MDLPVIDTALLYKLSENLPFIRHIYNQPDYIAIILTFLKCLMLVISMRRFHLLLVGLVVTLGYLVLFLKKDLTLTVLWEEVLYFWALLCVHLKRMHLIPAIGALGMGRV